MSEEISPDAIRDRLRSLTLEPRFHLRETSEDLFADALTQAAVLIPLTETDRGMEIVLTQRSQDLRQHSGEISFPGGRRDATDRDLVHTALRETHEEIALAPECVQVYGALMRMPTVTGYSVTTYVGEFSSPCELVPNPAEIDALIEAPLTALADHTIHRVEKRTWNGIEIPVHFFDYDGHIVWGATGFMLHTLLDYLGLR